MAVLATPANMRKYERQNRTVQQGDGSTVTILAAQPFAYSPFTDERCSATPGDYWNFPDNEPLTDSEGEPMILVFERTRFIDADDTSSEARGN